MCLLFFWYNEVAVLKSFPNVSITIFGVLIVLLPCLSNKYVILFSYHLSLTIDSHSSLTLIMVLKEVVSYEVREEVFEV